MNSTRTFTYESMIAEIKSYYTPAGDYAIITESHDGEIEYLSIRSECWKFPGYGEMLAAKRRQGRRNPKISRSQRAQLDTQYTRERVFELFREKSQNNRRVALIYCANWFTKFVAAQSGIDAGAYEYPVLLPGGDAGMYPAAHPRSTDEDTPSIGAGGGNPAADLDAEDTPETDALEDEIACTVHRIRQHQEAVERASASISELKDRLEALLKVRGSNWSDDDGYARLYGESKRVNYSAKVLDDLIAADPLKFGWLSSYRKESTLAGRVVVK